MITLLFHTHSEIHNLIYMLQEQKFAMKGWDVSRMMYHGLGLWRDQSVNYPGIQIR